MSTATMNFGNVNTEDLNSNESVRNSVIEKLNPTSEEFMKYFDEIMEEVGLKFEFIPGINLTTAAHVAGVLGVSSQGVRKQINENNTEIELHGGQLRKSSEIQELLGNTMAATGSCGHFSLIKNGPNVSIILKNGTEFKLNNGESWYLTPEAVLDLCMFMTGTDKAIQVRSAIINKLKEGQKAQKTVNKVRNCLANTILDLSLAFDEYTLNDLVKTSFDTSSYKDKLKAKRLLSSVVVKLTEYFNKAQSDLGNGNIDSDTYNRLLTRINTRKQACLSVIVRISEELEEARKQTEETLSESNFTNGNVSISITEALKIWYSNNPTISKSDQLNASSLYKKFESFGILSGLDSKGNRKLTNEYKFIKNSFILPETLMSFSCKVNKYGYAFIDIILSIYYGKLILGDAKYNKNNYTMDDAEAYITGLTNKKDDELKEEITSLIITRVQNNCYALL